MKEQMTLLLAGVVAISLACQSLPGTRTPGPLVRGTDTPPAAPTAVPTSTEKVTADCAATVAAISGIQPTQIPEHLLKTGVKRGDEFDPNRYFDVLPHVSMQEGYVLDYVYHGDSLGAFPRLYVRPVDQAPYASEADVTGETKLPDFHDYLEIEDVEQGYLEYVAMDIMAGQFYLSWHANYNDTVIVCNRQVLENIISGANFNEFGNKFDLLQQAKARGIKELEPRVDLQGDTATVQVVVFTKWGGFYRVTYTISRQFPHKLLDVKNENLVPYDCGIMF